MWRIAGVLFLIVVSTLYVEAAKKNVLFLIADDLRPNLGVYSGLHLGQSHTPNLDGLASKSLLVKRAYVQYALCSPSRSSFMTGRRPDTTHVYDLHHYFRKVGGNYTTIPQYFKNHGYKSIGIGKIYHPGKDASNGDDPPSWSENHHVPALHHYNDNRQNASWRAISDTERKQYPLVDETVTAQAKKSLRKLAQSGEPFFLAVGFRKPHLPFEFPQQFLSHSDIHLPSNPYAPVGMPDIAWSKYGELRSFHDIGALHATGNINTTLPDHIVKDLRRAYFSAVSYMDSMVGEVLTELKTLNLMDNTIISFIGDHGYSLGEHGLWNKHTNFEDAVHAPMMIRVPGMTDNGLVTNKLVEFVDLFPTIVDAAGLPSLSLCPKDSFHVELCSEGKSMMSLMKNSSGNWKNAAFSQYRHGSVMGYTVRTDRYRFTEWVRFHPAPVNKPDYKQVLGVELYDHHVDAPENTNLALHADKASTVASLRKLLHAGWRDSGVNPGLIG